MQISAGLKIIENGWIQKPKGFRVKYQTLEEGELVTVYSPPEGSALLDSDVTAWRYAWKLFKSARADAAAIQPEELVNIHVVDDAGEKVKYYATNAYEVFNRKGESEKGL
jgi:hypothetical protein